MTFAQPGLSEIFVVFCMFCFARKSHKTGTVAFLTNRVAFYPGSYFWRVGVLISAKKYIFHKKKQI